jgi:hypothetical protein
MRQSSARMRPAMLRQDEACDSWRIKKSVWSDDEVDKVSEAS